MSRISDIAPLARGLWWGAYELIEDASLYKTFTTGLRPWENHTTALAGEEMHPFWWLAPPPSPRRGDFILRYALS